MRGPRAWEWYWGRRCAMRTRSRPGSGLRSAWSLLGLLAGGYTAPLAFFLVDKMHAKPVSIEVGIFTRKFGGEGDRVAVGSSFGRPGTADGRPGPPQIITDAAVYQEAFDRLSKALSLEARES